MNTARTIIAAFFCLALIGTPAGAYAQAQNGLSLAASLVEQADTAKVLNPGSAEPLILTAFDAQKKLTLFTFKNGTATKSAEGQSLGHVWAATLYGTGKDARVLVAYGLGRGDLNAPLRVASYSLSLTDETVIHNFTTERAQMNFLQAQGDKVIATFFSSKYETETGALFPVSSKNWRYEKIENIRMATSVAADKDLIVFGRMYGDTQGQDGDLLLKKGAGNLVPLPSYRGVSSVNFFGPTAQILVGDGWHSNYGQFAQARLSLLSPVPGTPRYSLDLLHTFPNAYAVNRIEPTGKSATNSVILFTNNQLVSATPGPSWSFKVLFEQQNRDVIFDGQFVVKNSSDIYVLVSEGSAKIYKFQL